MSLNKSSLWVAIYKDGGCPRVWGRGSRLKETSGRGNNNTLWGQMCVCVNNEINKSCWWFNGARGVFICQEQTVADRRIKSEIFMSARQELLQCTSNMGVRLVRLHQKEKHVTCFDIIVIVTLATWAKTRWVGREGKELCVCVWVRITCNDDVD